jgi:hypothetical protein
MITFQAPGALQSHTVPSVFRSAEFDSIAGLRRYLCWVGTRSILKTCHRGQVLFRASRATLLERPGKKLDQTCPCSTAFPSITVWFRVWSSFRALGMSRLAIPVSVSAICAGDVWKGSILVMRLPHEGRCLGSGGLVLTHISELRDSILKPQ